MRLLSMTILVLSLCGCGGSGGGGGSNPTPTQSVSAAAATITISGQVDLNGATLETPATAPTVEVNGTAATVTPTANPDVFDWEATVTAPSNYTDYRVEYFANGNLIGAVDYAVDP